jgi:DNA-binding GntR family transcriptional regulator
LAGIPIQAAPDMATASPAGSERRGLVARIYVEIRDLIVRGQLAPGTRVIESEVVARLGVSRTTVRAALQRLQQEGYVSGTTTSGRARPVVTPLTREDVFELFAIVGEIEGIAAERAAQLPARERAALVATLAAVNADYHRAAGAAREGDALFALDTRFHRTYVEAGAGPRLVALHDAIKPQAERYIRFYQTILTEAIQTSIVEHQAIIDRIDSGVGPAAQEAVRTNWRNAAERLSGVIGRRGERGAW